jgi:Icc-related predicted phosphoesterase
MLLVALTDIHGKDENIDSIRVALAEADAIIISGDITHFGREKETVKVLENIKKYNSNILAVSGNCDYPGVEAALDEYGFNINGSAKYVSGFLVTGLAGSLPCPGRTPNEFTEDELGAALEKSISLTGNYTNMILISHQPPVNTLNDQVSEGVHVGSKAVRSFIENYQPLVCFTGHIHEGIGIDTIGKTKIVNPGPLWYGKYAYARITEGQIEELEIKKI